MLGDYTNKATPFPVRDKYWREKTADEKIETLADLLAQAWRTIRELNERADDMGQHAHHPHTGHVMVSPRDQYSVGRHPPGYNHEEFMLGKAPREHYDGAPTTGAGWAGEAQVEGCLPQVPPQPAPATGPENQPEKVIGEVSLEDPDWPKPAQNPQFHGKLKEC